MDFSGHKNFQLYHGQNILSVDYGTKVTGFASFCPGREPYPIPYGTIRYVDDQSLCQSILKIVHQESIQLVVLGIPYLLDGKSTRMTEKIRQFGEKLQASIAPVAFIFQDETLSSYEALDRLNVAKKLGLAGPIDAVAATVILEDFIRKS